MMSKEPLDRVDHILAQWRRERPDLDVEPMALLGRLNRLTTHLAREVETVLLKHGLSSSAFDVLAHYGVPDHPTGFPPAICWR